MEQRGILQEKEKQGGLFKTLIFATGLSLLAFLGRKRRSTEEEARIEEERREGRTALAGWLIVCAVALLFTLYGFFAYFVIGDKGSPDWDYGSIPDLPAQSAYSTYPYRGEAKQPEPQHINRKPPVAKSGLQPDQIPSVPEPGPSKEQQP